MTVTTSTTTPRWRLITFWVLLVVLLFLYLGERPQQLGFVVTAFGGFPAGAGATHEFHWFAQGVVAWVIVAAVLAQLRRPAAQMGAAWVYGIVAVLTFGLVLSLADLPAEVVPIVLAATVIAALAFLAHPSPLRARLAPVAPRSRVLLLLAAVAAVPFTVYAVGQFDIHLSSGPLDEHHEFGHWIVMGAYGLLVPILAAVAASKVSGWRFPLWVAGAMSVALGVGSLGITAVSQLTTLWSLLAIAWGVVFVGVGELEAARVGPVEASTAPERRPSVA
jgi:hypothetical protein